jgi:uncharacterized protein (DUF302 family)
MGQRATRYGMSVRLPVTHEQAVARVTAALKAEGFGVLTEIDVKKTLRQKLNAEFRDYVILGACNPPLAHRALQADLDVGLLLPCNVVVYTDGSESVVAIIDPVAMLDANEHAALRPIADEAKARLDRVLESLRTE